ncbi:Forkhead-associated (FHA) domain [Trypanosoma melophagium]|uniref:Forkhead-associated (FHA) domain n=1 Tax=Trypanosoma melophagium TaxID=715481 RepID=UPI00351A0436|nr:Forkhead-associated (FHA) domain [Trypanosoma melophagium]
MEVAIVGVYNLSRLSAFGGITAVPGRSPDVFTKEREFMPSYVRHESVDEHKRCRLIARFFCGRDGMLVTSGNEGGKSNRISSLPVLLIIPLGRDPMGGNSGVIAYKVAAQGSLLSRRHCVLQLCSSNSLHIPHTINEWCALSVRDCGSLNGTFVNGRRLASGAVSTPVIFDPCDVNAWNEPLLTLELGAGAKLVAGDSLSRSQLQLRFHVFVRCIFVQEQAAWIRRRLEGSCVDMTEKHVSSVGTKENHLDDMNREEKLRTEENSLEQGPVLVNECNAVSTRNSSEIMRSVCQRKVFSNDEQHSNLKGHNDKKSEISPFSISLIYGNESKKKDNLTANVPLGVFTNTHMMPNILTASNSSKQIENEKEKKESVVVNQESDVRNNTDELPPRINTEIPGGNLKTFNYGVSEKSPDQGQQQENSIEERIPNLSPVLIKKKKTLIDSPDTHDSLNNRYAKGNLAPSAVKVSESSAGATLLPYNSQSPVDVSSLEDKIVQVKGEKNTSELSQEEVLNIQEPVPHNFHRTKSESLSLPTSQDDRVIALPRSRVIKQEKPPQDESCITVNKTPPSIDCQVSSVGVVSYKEPPIQTLTKRCTKRRRTIDVKETVKNFMAELREGPTKAFSSEKSEPSITAAAAVLRSGLEIGALSTCNSESKSLVNTSEQLDMGSDHLLGRNDFSSVTDERDCITISSTNSQLVVHAPKHIDAELERKQNMSSTTILQKRPNHLILSKQISGNNAKKVSRLKVAEKKRQRLACVISAIDQCFSDVPRCTHHYSSGVTHLEHFNLFYKLVPVCHVPQELHLVLRENQLEGLRFIWSLLLCEPQTFAQQTKSVMTKVKGDIAFCTSTSSEKQIEKNFSIQKSNNTLTRGCVFPSTMGFGNSFITIAFLYIAWSFLRVNPNHFSLPLCLRK